MGGNVKVDGQGSEPIKINMRKERRHDVERMLHSINRHSKHELWGFGAPSLTTGDAYSGSTAHFMNKELKDEELGKYKKSFGDIDVMVPKEKQEALKAALQPGTKHGKFTVVGTKPLGGQISAIVQHDDGKHHQVDFEFKDFDEETQSPTDFAKFSQNSHIDDLKTGLKGTAHKVLMLALTAKEGTRGVVEKIKKGQSVYSSEQSIRPQTFSQLYGMRQKHVPSLDADGKQKMHNGKPVYNELGSENAAYETDLSKIHEHLFGKPGKDSDIEKMSSFHGIVKLMKKHLQPHEQRNVINEFASKLYDKRAASHMDGDPKKDNEIKVHTLRELRKHFPEHFDKLMYDTISKYRDKYYDKPAENIKENIETELRIAMAAGRFTGPTKEHEKLINEVFAQPADQHYIYVMGPSHPSETTAKDPLTIDEKLSYLRQLYPSHRDSFVPGNTDYTKTPPQAMAHIWHTNKDKADKIHLTVVAGDGDKGVIGKDAGGSAGAYQDMIDRLNKTKYPVRTTSDGRTVGGDYRMDYASTNVVRNPRGDVSGSVMRQAAREGDINNPDAVKVFMSLLHSGISMSQARKLMSQIQSRGILQQALVLADLIGENYERVEETAKNLDVPVELVESIVEGSKTLEEMDDRLNSICTRIALNENTVNLLASTDTFVIFYHPEKLFYQIERIRLKPDEDVKEQAVVKARLQQGYIITSVHDSTSEDVSPYDAVKYRNRMYRRQIDD